MVPNRRQKLPTGPVPPFPTPPSQRDRHVHVGGSHAAERVAVHVVGEHHRRCAGRLQERADRRRRARPDPAVQREDRGVEHPVRASRVDGQVAGEGDRARDRLRRALHRDEVLDRALAAPAVTGSDLEAVEVVVRRARDLPQPELGGVGLAGGEYCYRSVGLGLEDEHGHVEIRADRRGRRAGERRPAVPGTAARAGRDPAVHEEAVVDVHERMHGVDVGDQAERRLRFAGARSTSSASARAGPCRGGSPERLPGLREDVVREAVAGVRRATP